MAEEWSWFSLELAFDTGILKMLMVGGKGFFYSGEDGCGARG